MITEMNKKSLYLKISAVLFYENSRDERELLAAEKAGWNNIHVIAPKGQESLYSFYGKRCYNEVDLRPLGNCRLVKPIGKMIAFYKYIHIARKLNPDVISGHDLLGLLIAYLSTIGLKQKPKLIYDAHEYEMGRFTGSRRSFLKSKLIFLTEKYLIKKSVLTITVNNSIYEQMKADYNFDFPAVVVRNIPVLRTIDKNRTAYIREEWQNYMDLTSDDKIFIYHGMVSPGRGIEEAIDAVSSTGCGGLVIMGNCDDKYKHKLVSLISKSQNSKRIMFHEAVNGAELIDYLAAADIGVVIIKPVAKSYYYALPNKLFESIHAGNPVIASDLPEIKRIVQKYDVGLICNSGDKEGISREWVSLSEQNLEEVYSHNLETARKRLNWQVESKKLVNALKGLLFNRL